MYGRKLSHLEGCNPGEKINIQNHRHIPTSQNAEKMSRKVDHRQQRIAESKNSAQHNNNSTSTGSTNHVSKSASDRSKQHKSALRECGDWTQHISSSGKHYFYNVKSSVSQWEKPKDWNDSSAIDLKPTRPKANTKAKQVRGSTTHKSHNATTHDVAAAADREKPPDYRNHVTTNCDYRDVDYREMTAAASDRDYRTTQQHTPSKPHHNHHHYNTTVVGSNGQSLINTKSESSYKPTTGEFYDYSNWNGICPPPLKSELEAARSNNTTELPRHDHDTTQQQHPSTDIDRGGSSSSKPPDDSSAPNHCSAQHNPASAPVVAASASSAAADARASKFVRTLSDVLSQAASSTVAPSHNGGVGRAADSHDGSSNLKNVLQQLLDAASRNRNNHGAGVSSVEDKNVEESSSEEHHGGPTSAKRICNSSDGDRSKAEAGGEQQATNNNGGVAELLPLPVFNHLTALREVFDPTAISHVQNWAADGFERQTNRLSDDYHKFAAYHMSDVNAQLATARSKVRVAEILSTLHEQRVLYLRQQIADLEKASGSNSNAGPYT